MSIGVGIDIDASAVRVAVVRTAYRKTSLEALVSAEIAEAGGVTEALRAAMAGALAGKPFDAAAVAIEGYRAAVHTLSLPSSALKQLAEILPFELEAAMPVDMSESIFDYRVLPKARLESGAEDPKLEVLTVVGRIDDVRARIDLVKGALGIEPERVGVGAFPLANLVSSTPILGEAGPIVIVDLGLRSSEVLFLANGEAVFARTLSFGTEGLPGTAPKLARELRVTVAAYRASGGMPPARVFLCGVGAFESGAESFLAAELELPVERLPPPSIDFTLIGSDRAFELPRFAKAIGLALGLGGRGVIDLRRGPLAYERGFAWVREKVPVLAGLAAVIVVSFFFSAWAQLHAANKDQTRLEGALATVTKDVLGEETNSATRAQELLSQQTGVNDDDPMPHADAFDVMVKLSEDISPSTVHDIEELDVNKGHVVLRGIVGTIPEAQSISASLANEKCFSDVKITRTAQVPGGERQKYVLELDIKCPEDIKGGAKKPSSTSGAANDAGSSGGK
jgi:general secretion pathway protein L